MDQYIYIVSRGHSGSTLCELLLGAHKDIFAMGELQKFSLQIARDGRSEYPGLCSCGKRPVECRVWKAAIDELSRVYGVPVEEKPFAFRVSDVGWEEDFGRKAVSHWLYRRTTRTARMAGYATSPKATISLGPARVAAGWVKHRMHLAEILSRESGALSVVDNSKDWLGMRDIYEFQTVPTKIVFLTRDVFGNAWSYMKNGRLSAELAARSWVVEHNRILKMVNQIPEQDRYHLAYEDLCTDPTAVSKKLCEFLGHDFDEGMLQFRDKEYHTIGGNKIRFSEIKDIRRDERWKERLSPEQCDVIADIAGPMRKKLKYGS